MVIRTEGDVLLELKEYNLALKAYKSLKNYCRRWRLANILYQRFHKVDIPEMVGFKDFDQQVMSLYY